jgi:glycosyltransferase involved in cell wall biosynthesis
MTRAINLGGWATLVLNFRYMGESGLDSNYANFEGQSQIEHVFEVGILGIKKEAILHNPRITYPMFASVLESLLTPILFRQELRAKTSVVHLVNCFKLPRALLRLITKVPVLAHFYETPGCSTADNFPLPIDALVASSRRIARTLEILHRGRLRIFTIPPAVDTNFFHPKRGVRSGRKVGLYIGSISVNRFPNELLQVFRQVIAADSEVSFRVIATPTAGNIARAHEIITICKSLGIEKKVSVSLRDMADADKLEKYTSARVFIFAPSRECRAVVEPPLTVIEAIASGLPVLATEAYSVPEAVISGKNGLVVSREKYASLAEAAIRMFQADEDQWLAWSEEARRVAAENFSILCASKRLADVHSALIEQ